MNLVFAKAHYLVSNNIEFGRKHDIAHERMDELVNFTNSNLPIRPYTDNSKATEYSAPCTFMSSMTISEVPAGKVYLLNNCPEVKNVALIPDQYRFVIINERQIKIIKPLTPYLKENNILVLVEDNKTDKDYFIEHAGQSFYKPGTNELINQELMEKTTPHELANIGLLQTTGGRVQCAFRYHCNLTASDADYTHELLSAQNPLTEVHSQCPHQEILEEYETLPRLQKCPNNSGNPIYATLPVATSRYQLIFAHQNDSEEIFPHCHNLRVIKEKERPLNMLTTEEWHRTLNEFYKDRLNIPELYVISASIKYQAILTTLNTYKNLVKNLISNDGAPGTIKEILKEASDYTDTLKNELSKREEDIKDILKGDQAIRNPEHFLFGLPDFMKKDIIPTMKANQISAVKRLSMLNSFHETLFASWELATLLLNAKHGGDTKSIFTRSEKAFLDRYVDQLDELRSCGTTLLETLTPLLTVE